MIERLTQEQSDEVDFEISDAEISRSAVHHRNVRGWPELGFEGADPNDMEAMLDRVFLGYMATDMFLDNPMARTATLGIIRLRGDWRRDALAQDSLIAPDARLQTEYQSRVFSSREQDNNLQHSIDAGIVSLSGIAMLTRQRRLLRTETFEHEFVHASGRRVMARLAIGVSKLSTFAVDLELLRKSPDAASEIHEILLADMVLRANKRRFQRIANVMGDFEYVEDQAEDIELAMPNVDEERAAMADLYVIRDKMREYNVSADVVLDRIADGNSLQVSRPETVEAIEDAIVRQNGLLIPSTSTFYGRRLLKSLSR